MNKTQRIILFVYAGLIALMTLFPPYHVAANDGRLKFSVEPSYGLLLAPKKIGDVKMFSRINASKLMIQYLGVTLICGGLLLAFREK